VSESNKNKRELEFDEEKEGIDNAILFLRSSAKNLYESNTFLE
jgi:hypothetical protein